MAQLHILIRWFQYKLIQKVFFSYPRRAPALLGLVWMQRVSASRTMALVFVGHSWDEE